MTKSEKQDTAGALEAEGASEGTFVRRSSGLVRGFSLRDAAILNFSNINFGLNLALVPILIITLFPQANLPLTVLIGGFIAFFHAGCYAFLGAAFPRAGGDYVFGGRIVGPAWGFAMNWAITWARVILVGLFSSWLVLYGIQATIGTVGQLTNNESLANTAETLSSKGWIFGLSLVAIVLMAAVVMAGPKIMKRIYWAMFIPAFIAAPVITVILVFKGHGAFVDSFNSHLGAGAYQHTIAAAHSEGINIGQTTLAGTLAGLPLGYYSYAGFTESVYFAGDIKQAASTQPKIIFGGLAFAVVLQTVMFALISSLVGKEFLAAIGGLQGTDAYPLAAPPLISALQSFMVGPVWLQWFIGIGIGLWVLMLVGVMILIPIRCMFAWSMDRLMPEALSKVTRSGTPWVAGLIVVVLGGVFAYIQTYSSFYTLIANVTLISIIVWLMGGITAILFPIRRPELYKRAPKFVQWRIGRVPVIQIFGVGSVLLHAFVLYYAFKYPAFSGPISWRSELFVAVLFLSAPAVYFAVRAIRRRREGIDLNLAYQGLPPE